VGAGRSGTCTLLGPEGPDEPCAPVFEGCGGDGFFRPSPKPALLVGWGFWPSVENYIVDASILDQPFRGLVT